MVKYLKNQNEYCKNLLKMTLWNYSGKTNQVKMIGWNNHVKLTKWNWPTENYQMKVTANEATCEILEENIIKIILWFFIELLHQ